MKKLDIASLELLVLAVEENSLTKAAKQENLVASAASKRISMLEARVGTALLQRHGRGVRPTPAGAMLYQRAKAILRNVQLAEDSLTAYNHDGNSKIRLVANPSTLIQWLPAAISSFSKRNPGVAIDLMEAHSKNVPILISDGDADIGIYHAAHPSPGIVSFPFRHDRIGLIVPQGHPLEEKGSLRLEEALDYDFLGYFPLHTLDAFMTLAGNTISRPPTVITQVSNLEARCLMVREGLGIAIVPETITAAYLKPLALRLLTLTDEWAERSFFLCVRDPEALRGGALKLFNHLRQN